MAYLIFQSNKVKDMGSFIRATKTEGDVEINHGGVAHTVSTIEITDEQYDDLLREKVELEMNDEVPSFKSLPLMPTTHGDGTDCTADEFKIQNEEAFVARMEEYKEVLMNMVNRRSNHSQAGKVTEALNFVTNYDLSSITYPTSDIYAKLREADKYVNPQCI